MISYPLTLKDSAAANVVFNSISIGASSTTSVDVASSDTEPRKHLISHTVEGKGATARNAHLVSLTKTKIDSNGVAQLLSVAFTLKKPKSSVFSSTDVADLVSMLLDELSTGTAPTVDTSGFLGQLLRGES